MKLKNVKKIIKRIINRLRGKKSRCTPFTFEVHITDYCNLNCCGCFHFAPLAKIGSIYDLKEFEADLSKIGNLFKNDIGWVHLMGGEPLLCGSIIDYLIVARNCLSTAKLSIITNGTLLYKMPEVFFEKCKALDIEIAVTRYPLSLDYEYLEQFVKSKGCKVRLFGNRCGNTGMKKMHLQNGMNQNYKSNFLNCNLSNVCITLNHGKLFYCSVPAYINFYNSYFNEKYDNSHESVPLKNSTKRDIVDFLRRPHEFCKYCDVNAREKNKLPWKVSKKEKEEWSD